MKFEVTLKSGKKHIIKAKDLDDAEVKVNKRWKNWTDILIIKESENV